MFLSMRQCAGCPAVTLVEERYKPGVLGNRTPRCSMTLRHPDGSTHVRTPSDFHRLIRIRELMDVPERCLRREQHAEDQWYVVAKEMLRR